MNGNMGLPTAPRGLSGDMLIDEDAMDRTKVLETLQRLGWKPAHPVDPSLASKRFGEQDAWAWYYDRGKHLTFEFYSCGRNVAESAFYHL
jgi:hypothetical protein